MAIERNVENKKKQTHLDLCILEACEKGDKEAVRKVVVFHYKSRNIQRAVNY